MVSSNNEQRPSVSNARRVQRDAQGRQDVPSSYRRDAYRGRRSADDASLPAENPYQRNASGRSAFADDPRDPSVRGAGYRQGNPAARRDPAVAGRAGASSGGRRASSGHQPASSGGPGRGTQGPSIKKYLIIAGIVAVVLLLAVGVSSCVRGCSGNHASTSSEGGEGVLASDKTMNAEELPAPTDDAGGIVIGVNGSVDTYVLAGEEYLEGGAHAVDAEDGIITPSIQVAGSVDASTPGDYQVVYSVTDSDGHTAQTTRRVHVVEDMTPQRAGVPVCMYHYVYTEGDEPDEINSNYILDSDLEAQLEYLTDNGFYYPSYPEVRGFLEGTHTLPEKSIVLTFDDGQWGFFKYGVPLLEEYGVPATSFIIASEDDAVERMVDNASPMIAYESHSYDMHRGGGDQGHGGRIWTLSAQEVADDLRQAAAVVGSNYAFAYPYGDVPDSGMQGVRDAGVTCAFSTVNEWAYQGDDPAALPRVRIAGEYSLDSFIYLVNYIE